jgi:hypothetical protein
MDRHFIGIPTRWSEALTAASGREGLAANRLCPLPTAKYHEIRGSPGQQQEGSEGIAEDGMFTRRARLWLLALAVLVGISAVGVWLLTPPRTESCIHAGMSRMEVEAIGVPNQWTENNGLIWYIYDCPDGRLCVGYDTGDKVMAFRFTRETFWTRIRRWLGLL